LNEALSQFRISSAAAAGSSAGGSVLEMAAARR